MLPALSPDGRLLLAADGGLFWSPDGHGGVIEGLRSSGLLAELCGRGRRGAVPLPGGQPARHRARPGVPRVPPPGGLRRLVEGRREVARRRRSSAPSPTIDGRPGVIEYSDLPDAAAGRPRRAGPPAVRAGIDRHPHAARRLPRPATGFRLPLHLARKRVRTLIPTPDGTDTEDREAVKFEMFVFDAIPLAGRCAVLRGRPGGGVRAAQEPRRGPTRSRPARAGRSRRPRAGSRPAASRCPRGGDGRPRTPARDQPPVRARPGGARREARLPAGPHR